MKLLVSFTAALFLVAAQATQEPLDQKRLRKIGESLESKDHAARSAALAELAKLLAANKDADADFRLVIEPLFDLSGWGGEARDNARAAEDLLVRIGKPAVPLLKARLNSVDGHDRRVAAELLVRVGPRDAALADRLRPLLGDRDSYVRKAAIEGVGAVGLPAKDAIGDLELVATTDPERPRRVGARIALIHVAGASKERIRALAAFLEPMPALADPAVKDGNNIGLDYESAIYAASALGTLGPKAKSAEPQLRAALKLPRLRSTAAHALGNIGADSPEAVAALIDLLKNAPEREARRSAATSLGAIGPKAKAAIPALHAALKGDGKGGWWVAADALAKIGGADVVPILIEALANPDEGIRSTSIKGLGDLGAAAKSAVPALEKVRQNDAREHVRNAAGDALRKIERAIQKTEGK